ncbi:MAG: hypothetical protein KC549_14210, partial [Myxococcales bacterium]|nr:hypothetical protein [Myxococcales bacterium]
MGKQWTGMWLAAALAACGPVEKSGNRGEAPAGGELPGDDGIEVADVRPDHEPTAPGRLQGRLDDDGGYQPAGQLPQGGAIAADRARLVDLQGRVLGEAAIGPDGRFSVGGLTATGEVTLVEVLAAGEPAGQVLVVPGLSVGGDAHTLPVSVETSVEASVYLRLVADGHAVDPIEVAVRVTPAMAAVCDVDGLTRAVWQAHQAFTRTLGSGAALDIAALTSARRRAWGELAVDLDTGHPEAWPNFMAAARVGLRGLGVDDETTLLAELAAGAALASHLDADACRTAGLAGAADQVARVGGPTVSPWVAGHPYAEAIQIEALARLGVAFADVEDAEDVEVAEDALIGALVGPVLTALVAGDEADEAVAHAAFQIALEARNDLEDVAGDGGEAIAQVALDLEARLELALAGLERDDLRGWLRAAAPWVACHLGGLIRIPGGHPPVEEPPVEEPPVVVDPTP